MKFRFRFWICGRGSSPPTTLDDPPLAHNDERIRLQGLTTPGASVPSRQHDLRRHSTERPQPTPRTQPIPRSQTATQQRQPSPRTQSSPRHQPPQIQAIPPPQTTTQTQHSPQTRSSPRPQRITNAPLRHQPAHRTSPPATTPLSPKRLPKPSPKRQPEQPVSPNQKRKVTVVEKHLDVDEWEHNMLSSVLKVTLYGSLREESKNDFVWLKELQLELEAEDENLPKPLRLNSKIADRLLVARLELSPQAVHDDVLPVLTPLPTTQTVFEYLVGCWKRLNAVKGTLMKGYVPSDAEAALGRLENLQKLIISYIGLTLQEPEMFPQPAGKPIGIAELLPFFLSLTSLSSPYSGSISSAEIFTSSDLHALFSDLASRFVDDGLDAIVAPIVRMLCFHPSLQNPEGLCGGDTTWRGAISGLECLVRVKGVAAIITGLPEWCPEDAGAATLERKSLMGPLLRLGVFDREWPKVASTYFSDPLNRTPQNIDGSNATLRRTLQTLQDVLFRIFNVIVRASPSSRESVLTYFAKAVNLNVKRGSMQVNFGAVASDVFMINLYAVLLRFAEPFMDVKYSKIDRPDPEFFRHSRRLDPSNETRLKATRDEAEIWVKEAQNDEVPASNFITEVFYLTVTINHYGLLQTIQEYNRLWKDLDEMERRLDLIKADTVLQGSYIQHVQIRAVKNEMAKLFQSIFAYQVQLADPKFMDRVIVFISFLSTWLIRLVDPRKLHPGQMIQLPLPQAVPATFMVLPEYFVEDIVDYYLFLLSHKSEALEKSGKNELVEFVLVFLSSAEYIANPYLKSKLVQTISYGTLPSPRGVLWDVLNNNSLALKHLTSCLISYYIEVEYTGTHAQFFEKFDTRRHIANIWTAIWTNPTHRKALNQQTLDLDKFVRFVNLMMNDMTFLLDESLSKLKEINRIQTEMADHGTWMLKSQPERRECQQLLYSSEFHAKMYLTLGNSTVALLKEFTAETKQPFMTPEIVDRLAATLTYNLELLAGPRCQELKVQEPDKYRFKPRELLSDILQVFLNLSDQDEFQRAVAGEGRSYKRVLFSRAAGIARKRALKTEPEIGKLGLFVSKVEQIKETIEAEDNDLGEIPDELLDPVTYVLMRDPVTLPSSKVVVDRSTIKAHLLSDASDPFNRIPLKLEEVVPNLEVKAKIDAFLSEKRNKGGRSIILEKSEEVEEIPDEFLDPLMFTLMRDPVTLPSGFVVDRSTIEALLQSDPNDPFNHVPLRLEDVVPNREVKAKIAAFLSQKPGKESRPH